MADILVVGAAGGVGSALAAMLAERGDTVHATVLNTKEEAMARAKIPALASVTHVDLGNAEATLEATRKLIADIGGVDAVAVCAAISPYGPLETASLALARRTFEINALSDLAIYQAAMPTLRARKGRIVFISSMAGRAGMPFIGSYVASKFALEGFADVMRREAQPFGVHVSLVEPGGVRTGMVDDQLATIVGVIAGLSDEERALYGKLYDRFQKLAGHSHVNSAIPPETVAELVIEALDADTPAARYIAGEDAKALIGMTRTLTDEQLDGAFEQMYSAVDNG